MGVESAAEFTKRLRFYRHDDFTAAIEERDAAIRAETVRAVREYVNDALVREGVFKQRVNYFGSDEELLRAIEAKREGVGS